MFDNNFRLKSIFFAGFLLSLHLALTAYINSSFLALYLREKNVGLLYTLGSIVSIVALLLIPKIFRKIGNYKFLLFVVGLNAISLLFLSISKNLFMIIPIFIFYLALNTMIIFTLDELLEILSKNSKIGKTRGFYITIISSAWVITQIISGTILSNSTFSIFYFISFVIMVAFFIVSLFFLRNLPDPKYDRIPVLRSLKIFFENKNLARSYKINFLLQFFYAFMIIYTPIYLNAYLNFTWNEIFIIFAIMLVPFIIVPLPLGKYSDKIGERKMLIFGFFVASLATLSLFFMRQHEIWIWALFLFITRIGASIIETMSDIYFFRHITPENDEFIGIYRNTTPVAFLLAPLVAFLIFTFTPSFNFIYVILGAVMLYGVYLSSAIRKSDI